MWKLFNTYHRTQLPRRRRRCGRASIHPELATIPETTSAADEGLPYRLDPHSHSHPSKRRMHRRHVWKTRFQLRQSYLQLCLLVLAPAHIIFTSLLVLNRPMRPASLRFHSRLQLREHEYRLPSTASPQNKGRGITDPNTTTPKRTEQSNASRMSKNRVVILSLLYENKLHMNMNHDIRMEMMKKMTIKDFEWQSEDNIHKDESPHTHKEEDINKNCSPMAKWQTMSYPTCNSLHEINAFSSSPTLSYFPHLQNNRPRFHQLQEAGEVKEQSSPISDSYSLKILGRGWFRHAWEVADSSHGTSIAIKTLRLERDFLHEYYELHRRDAVAMERLTPSPYVMDIFGYCGQSALTELAFLENGMSDLYRLSSGLKGNDSDYVLRKKLQIAAMISLGLAHIHRVALDGTKRKGEYQPATIAHYDINPRNVIMTRSGKPKINDFNVAEFLKWDSRSEGQKQCGFEARFHEPWWRSPEEMIIYENNDGNTTSDKTVEVYPKNMLSEKVDVYSLGNTLYVLLTGLEPRGKEHKQRRLKSVSNMVASGESPHFPDEYSNSTSPAIRAIRQAIRLCWEPNPSLRPAAIDIAQGLLDSLDELKYLPSHAT